MEVSGVGQGRQSTNTETTKASNGPDTKIAAAASVKTEAPMQTVSEKEVRKAVEKLNVLFEDKSTHVQYEVYGKFHNITIRIIDDKTDQVIKEIPPKKLIDMVDKLCQMAGILVDEKA